MKKILIVFLLTFSSLNAFAQLEVIEIREHADTLLHAVTSGMDVLDVYRGPQGYMIRDITTNMYDSPQKFYLGQTVKESIESLRWLSNLCDRDVATQAIVKDAIGKPFTITTVLMANVTRRPYFTQGDRIAITNESMAGVITIKKKTIEETIKYFERLK